MIRHFLNKTSYELLKGTKFNTSYFQIIGCKCFLHNNGKRNLGKFDARSVEEVFLGYALTNKTYKVYNKRIMFVGESVHIIFDDTNKSLDVVEYDEFEILLTKYAGHDEDTITKKQHDEIPRLMVHENEENDIVAAEDEQQNMHNQNGTGNL